LTVQANGFVLYKQSGITLSAGSTETADVKLQVQGLTTEEVVSSAAPILDPACTDQGSTRSSNAVAESSARFAQSFQLRSSATKREPILPWQAFVVQNAGR